MLRCALEIESLPMLQKFTPVSANTLKDLSSQQAVADFFEERGYSTDGNATLSVLESKALLEELHRQKDWVRQVKGFQRIGQREDATGVMRVYLYTVERVTQSLAKEIFRDHCAPGRGDETLAVLVDQDYANIEIVYVDHHAGAAAALQQPLPGMKATSGKPQFRALSITRLSGSTPNKVVRALNRFFWPTQRSVAVQRAILSSAFDLVEWSEDYFNNRALFSDHYLNRMQDDQDDKEWQSTKESGGEGYLFGKAWEELRIEYERFQEAYEQLKQAKKTLSAEDRQRTKQTSEALNQKVLDTLGFVARAARNKRDKEGRRIAADYLLCERMPDGKAGQPRTLCLAYEWDRNLDGYADEDSDAETLDMEVLENPGAVVVSLLGTERGQAEWVIVTNGKLWRLYSAKAHNRATNYYEIDLQEALAIPRTQSEEAKNAFRYFWLFFRAKAFIPDLHGEEKEPSTFLDYILRQSTHYAVTLGDSLKKKIFDEVFEHFAGGLVHDARRQGTLPTDLTPYTEEEQQRLLKPFFYSTLTFLYRLLFVLYAESRSLLPVYERRGYYEHSLQQLKEKIARELTNNRANAEHNLTFTPDEAFDYYEGLKELFAAIDKGNEQWNIPVYNGGLFQTKVEKDISDLVGVDADGFPLIAQATPEEILATHNIDNRALMAGLDLLARDEDEKRHGELLMIDYKSLGVRQLGSIYEGLLEFRLRVASERIRRISSRLTRSISRTTITSARPPAAITRPIILLSISSPTLSAP
jgi:hypothetical protein